MRPLRVLAVIKGLDRGGAESLLADTAERLDRREIALTVARTLAGADGLTPRFARAGVPVVSLGGRRGTDPRWVLRLRTLLHRGGFDLAHTHSPMPAAATRLVAPRRLPLVHTEHSSWEHLHPLTRAANALTYPRVAEVIAVSHAVAATIRRPRVLGACLWPPVRVIHHGIDPAGRPQRPAGRRAARQRLDLAEEAEVVGCVANFDPEKDHDTLVDAFAQLVRERPAAQLVLVGFGPTRRAVEAHVRRRGLAGRVHFAGDRDDVADLLPGFDVFALASRHEGFGLAVLEAMAARVPVVATDVDGVPEAVGDADAARLVAPGDPLALAGEIGAVLADPTAAAAQVEAAGRRVEEIRPGAAVTHLRGLYHAIMEGR